jgi:hypothetical protein
VPLTFAHRVYLFSVGFISPGLRDDARLIPSQLPDEGTVCKPRVAPHTMPAVVASSG